MLLARVLSSRERLPNFVRKFFSIVSTGMIDHIQATLLNDEDARKRVMQCPAELKAGMNYSLNYNLV